MRAADSVLVSAVQVQHPAHLGQGLGAGGGGREALHPLVAVVPPDGVPVWEVDVLPVSVQQDPPGPGPVSWSPALASTSFAYLLSTGINQIVHQMENRGLQLTRPSLSPPVSSSCLGSLPDT